MGAYDSGAYNSGTYSTNGNAFQDQRQTARERLLDLLDKQKVANQSVASARDKVVNNQNFQANTDWMGKGLKGASLGAAFGPVGAGIGAGIGAIGGIFSGVAAHRKRGDSWLDSIGGTLAENPGRAFDSFMGSPMAGAGVAGLARGVGGDSSRSSSAADYDPSSFHEYGNYSSGGISGPSMGSGPEFSTGASPFKFSDEEGIEG